MRFFVYLVECSDKTYYCGCTKDIRERLGRHNRGKAAKYTRARLPVRLVYLERKKSKGEALKREAEIKSMSRKQKQEMVAGYVQARKNQSNKTALALTKH